MKKKLAVTTCLAAIIASSFAIGVYAASDIKLLINGKAVDTQIEIIDGSSYVPLRVVSESLGADVKWDGDSRTISITGGSKAVEAPKSDAKSFNVNVNVESGPMRLNITKVTLDPAYKRSEYSNAVKAVILDSTVENTSDMNVSWSPDGLGSKLILNTKEQIESASFSSDRVGGEFVGKVIKSGKIIFEVKGDLTAVTSMNYVVDGAYNSDSYARIGQNKTADIVLK